MILLSIIAVLMALDVYTTKLALDKGAREANPVVRFILDKFGYGGFVVVKVALVGYLFWLGSAVPDWAALLIIGAYIWVVYNNYSFSRKAK